jgi:hypothetical protein
MRSHEAVDRALRVKSLEVTDEKFQPAMNSAGKLEGSRYRPRESTRI